MKLLLFLLCAFCAFLSFGLCYPCDWVGVTPEAYYEYHEDKCPSKRTLMSDGHCNLWGSDLCRSFCQVKTTFHYETEMPLGGSLARGPGWFGSSDWHRIAMQWEEPIKPFPNLPFDVLSSGISGGLDHANRGLAEIAHMDALLDYGECGYFTFLPMTKAVCGTYTEATPWSDLRGPNCDKNKKSLPNICVTERSSYPGENEFYKWASEEGHPTVRGHMAFVWVDCVTGFRLPAEKQDARYALAMLKGGVLSDDDYEGYRRVWNNRYVSDKMLPDTYGFADQELFCLSMNHEMDQKVQDAVVSHCWYRIGELMKEPDRLLPIQKKNTQFMAEIFKGGCGIYVAYQEDWAPSCKVSYAEVAAAAQPVTFSCLKKQFKKGKNRWGVKGTHTLRAVGSGEKCGAKVVVWGGGGKGINIGPGNKAAANYSGLDDENRAVFENMDLSIHAPVEFGDPMDPDLPYGVLGWNFTGLQYDPTVEEE